MVNGVCKREENCNIGKLRCCAENIKGIKSDWGFQERTSCMQALTWPWEKTLCRSGKDGLLRKLHKYPEV